MISVIVPIYKIEAYLHRCVDSILGQTYEDIEIILVNDGSPDECPRICDEYAQKDKRIKVIHKKNGGLSDARNAGLEIASGDFITFVDGDDIIHPEMLEQLMSKMIQYDADISSCSSKQIDTPDDIQNGTNETVEHLTMTGEEAMEALFLGIKNVKVMSWARLYKTELFSENKIRFPIGRIHEDCFTTYELFYLCKKIYFTNQKFYYHVRRVGSIIGQPFSLANLDTIEAAKQAIKFVKDRDIPLLGQAYHYYLSYSFYRVNVIIREGSYKKWSKILQEIRIEILNFAPVTRGCRYITFNQRIGIFLLRFGLQPYIAAKKLQLFFATTYISLRKRKVN